MDPLNKKYILILVVIGLITGSVLGVLVNRIDDIEVSNIFSERDDPDLDNDDDDEEDLEVDDVFKYINNSWSSESVGWEGNFYQTKVSQENIIIEEGYDFGHFAKKIKDANFSELIIDLEIPNFNESAVDLEIVTGSEDYKEDISDANFPTNISEGHVYTTRDDREGYNLESGMNRIDIKDVEWGKYSFFKIILDREYSDVSSPIIRSMDIKE